MPPPASDPIVGIDLGTTNSLVAIATPPTLQPRILGEDGPDRGILPSAVRFEPGADPVVGLDARDRAVEFPERTVLSVKRLMGRSLADASEDLRYLHYGIVEGPHNTARIQLPDDAGGTRTVTPQEVSALILRELKDRATRELGQEVRRAVITVPAYFDDAQRQATRDAARLAGLEAVRIVNEPTAAALAYGLGLRADRQRNANAAEAPADERTVVVYDLGGGTFDISILRLTPGAAQQGNAGAAGADAFEVLATAGDTHLGGDDFDNALIDLFTREIHDRFVPPDAPRLQFPPATRRALRAFAEATKVRLSEHDAATVQIDLGPDPNSGEPRLYNRTITRDEFETLIAPLVQRTLDACRRAARDARRALRSAPLDAVVLVGGSTRVPLVRRMVAEHFGMEPYTALDPDRVVALGAAVQAAVLAGHSRDALLYDVVPLSLGIETAGGAVAKLIMRNTTVPTRATETFSTSIDGQTSIKINILQGEREMAEDCRSLGMFHLGGIPAMPAGLPKLLVTFDIDANAILHVSAVEERSGRRADLQIIPNHGLTRDEVDRIEAESFEHAREDMTRHRIADLIANSKLDLNWTRDALRRAGEDLSPEQRADLDARLTELESLITRAEADWQSVDPNAFQAAKEALDRSSMRLHELAITRSLRDEEAKR